MDNYTAAAQAASRLITERYSTSFSLAIRLMDKKQRQHIYNIYGLVRTADEIVDSYSGLDAKRLLRDLHTETLTAITRGFSPNPIVHAFTQTARRFGLTPTLISPFFASMERDLTGYKPADYKEYIYGSAEVIGLMCMRVFCGGDDALYKKLSSGAQALGAAFQKINFLRDIADDHTKLGRYYFPTGSFEDFTDVIKEEIVADIHRDLAVAKPTIAGLPGAARPAVTAAYHYFKALLDTLEYTPADIIKQRRLRISNGRKFTILAATFVAEKLRRSR